MSWLARRKRELRNPERWGGPRLYHDLLPWNVLVDGDRVRVIDFTLSEFNGHDLMSHLPNPGWAQAGKDRQLLGHYGEPQA